MLLTICSTCFFEWVRALGVGVVHGSFRTLGAAVAETLVRLPELRANVGRVHNRAVFEVPQILERLLEQAERQPRPRLLTPEVSLN